MALGEGVCASVAEGEEANVSMSGIVSQLVSSEDVVLEVL